MEGIQSIQVDGGVPRMGGEPLRDGRPETRTDAGIVALEVLRGTEQQVPEGGGGVGAEGVGPLGDGRSARYAVEGEGGDGRLRWTCGVVGVGVARQEGHRRSGWMVVVRASERSERSLGLVPRVLSLSLSLGLRLGLVHRGGGLGRHGLVVIVLVASIEIEAHGAIVDAPVVHDVHIHRRQNTPLPASQPATDATRLDFDFSLLSRKATLARLDSLPPSPRLGVTVYFSVSFSRQGTNGPCDFNI
mmetsp:Transcript_7569/g.22211  ORF Transcript_7569/g.22211 Transcript_7569/m.22211 type:complete len:245 (+) Transcript_7569:447-1181(+)